MTIWMKTSDKVRLRFCLIVLFVFCGLTCCTNFKPDKTKAELGDTIPSDLLSLIVITEWKNSLTIDMDPDNYTDHWVPYQVLRLDGMKLMQIKEIYGEPSLLEVDTFLYGNSKNNKFGELDVDTMLSKIPSAEVYMGHWYLNNTLLRLYLLNNNGDSVVFYGYKFNPYKIMME